MKPYLKQILLAACAVLALAGTADARSNKGGLPDHMLGGWCQRGEDNSVYDRRESCDDTYLIVVARDGYTFNGEDECEFDKVEKTSFRSWKVQARCGGEGFPINKPVSLLFQDQVDNDGHPVLRIFDWPTQ